jgi:hypothetical protein
VIRATVDIGDRVGGKLVDTVNAAVFSRNMGMSGTSSIAITAAATRWASACLSWNIPAGAYTSIIGIESLPPRFRPQATVARRRAMKRYG